MAAPSVDIEFSKYWSQLKRAQKQALLDFIKSFPEQAGEKLSGNQENLELQEGQAQYNTVNDINHEELLKHLTEREKKSLLLLIKTFLQPGHPGTERISIEQYNKELEEAEAEFERGDIYTHAEVIAMSKGWVNGK